MKVSSMSKLIPTNPLTVSAFAFALAATLALTAAVTTPAVAQPNSQGGGAACKAPSGEPHGLGETIDLPVTDGKGNIVKETYLCTENGWVKVSKIVSGPSLHLGPGHSLVVSRLRG
jgi:hypothetical protein